jgi:hypothetical protein
MGKQKPQKSGNRKSVHAKAGANRRKPFVKVTRQVTKRGRDGVYTETQVCHENDRFGVGSNKTDHPYCGSPLITYV